MKPTTINEVEKLTVDLAGLMSMLSCGKSTAKKIATQANATIHVSERKKLYNVNKIRQYLNH